MTLTQKGTRPEAAAATGEDILESDPETVARGEKKREDDENLESKKQDKAIAEWIGRPFKTPLRNKNEEDNENEEDVGDPLASTEDGYPGNKDNESREDNWEEDNIYKCKDKVIYYAEDKGEESSLGHEGELLS